MWCTAGASYSEAPRCNNAWTLTYLLSGTKFQIKSQGCFYCGFLSPCTPPLLQVPLSNLCLLLVPIYFPFLAAVAHIPNKESLRSENLRVVWHREGAVEGPVVTLSPRYHCHLHDWFSLLSALSAFRQVTQSLWYLVVLSLNPVMWSKAAPSSRIWQFGEESEIMLNWYRLLKKQHGGTE